MEESQAGASASMHVNGKQNAKLAHTAVKSTLMEPPGGLCLQGRSINTEELWRHTVIPGYLRNAMADVVHSKGFVYEERCHKGTGEENSPEAPVVVFINSKSGGRLGPKLKNQLQDLISQEQKSDESASVNTEANLFSGKVNRLCFPSSLNLNSRSQHYFTSCHLHEDSSKIERHCKPIVEHTIRTITLYTPP